MMINRRALLTSLAAPALLPEAALAATKRPYRAAQVVRFRTPEEPESIGSAASSGCIRMLNEEVTELYDNVTIGTKVIVL